MSESFKFRNVAGSIPRLPERIASTFENGQYVARELAEDLVVYRGEGGRFGRWFGTTKPTSAADAERLYNVVDYGSDLAEVVTYRIPAGTVVYEGPVAGGKGIQIFIHDPRLVGTTIEDVGALVQYGF